jgi:hypothetical protein
MIQPGSPRLADRQQVAGSVNSQQLIAALRSHNKQESYALSVGLNGLSHLYSFVKSEEQRRLQRDSTLSDVLAIDFGASDRDDVIFNHFFWYATSFIAFVDLFSHAYKPRLNLRTEFRHVTNWRNDVAAHFRWVKRPKTPATAREASISQFLTWRNGRFSVGRERYFNPDTGGSSPADWGWELTEVHDRVLPIIATYC